MDDAMGSLAAGRELAALGRVDGMVAMLSASGPARRREAHARRRPASPAEGGRKRPRRARSCIRARENMASAI
jgi:hypothetical protein